MAGEAEAQSQGQQEESSSSILPALLLGAGVGGLGGAFMTNVEDEKDPKARFRKRLKNALIGALTVGGGAGLLSYGANSWLEGSGFSDGGKSQQELEKMKQDAMNQAINTGLGIGIPTAAVVGSGAGIAKGLSTSGSGLAKTLTGVGHGLKTGSKWGIGAALAAGALNFLTGGSEQPQQQQQAAAK